MLLGKAATGLRIDGFGSMEVTGDFEQIVLVEGKRQKQIWSRFKGVWENRKCRE